MGALLTRVIAKICYPLFILNMLSFSCSTMFSVEFLSDVNGSLLLLLNVRK